MIKEGKLPYVRIGNAVRVPATAFAAYMTAKTSRLASACTKAR